MKARIFAACALAIILAWVQLSQAKETRFQSGYFWSEESNWSNGLPEEGDDVYIDVDCIVDDDADVPELASLTINATLDNTDAFYPPDFYVTGDLNINDGGNFKSDGAITVYDSLFIWPNGTGTFNADVDVWGNMWVEDEATFNGDVDVDGHLYFGSPASLGYGGGYFTVTFNGQLEADDMDVGVVYGTPTVVCKDTVDVGNLKIQETLKIYKFLSCFDLTLENYGSLYAYGGISCDWGFQVDETSAFYSQGDYTYTVAHILDMDGTFQVTQGTFKMNPSSSASYTSAEIHTGQDCYLYNLVISGGKPTEVHQSDSYPLDIRGDLTVEEGKTLNAKGSTIKLAGDFNCAGTYTYGAGETPTFIFNGSGTQNLSGNVGFYHLTINSGSTVNTGSYTPSVAPASLTENGYLQGKIKCTQDISSDATYSLGNLGCQITNGSGLGTVPVTRHTGSAHSGASHSLTRWYNISASSADNSVTLRLEYRDSELNGNDEANLNIWRYSGGNWTKYAATSRDASSNYVEAVVEVPSGGSDWVLSDAEDDQSLPVEFISASATFDAEHNAVQLRWKVASEVDNLGFTIDRRILPDGQYSAIGFVGGRGSEPTAMSYSYADKLISPDTWYAYRISSKHLDGTLTVLTDELKVFTKKGAIFPKDLTLYQNQPNPFRGATTLRFWLPAEENTTLRIYDLRGRLVYQHSFGKLKRGMHQVVWQGRDDAGHDFCAGLYFYELQAGEHRLTGKMIRIR